MSENHLWGMLSDCPSQQMGTCENAFFPGDKPDGHRVAAGLAMMTLSIRILILFLLIRFLYMTRKAAEDGYERYQRISVFPVHREFLVYIACVLVITCGLKSWRAFASYEDDAPSHDEMVKNKLFLMGAVSQGLHHAISEGMVVLFVSPGCGRKTLKRFWKFGAVWFVFITSLYAYCNWGKKPDTDAGPQTGLLLGLPIFLAIAYGILWLLPQCYALVIVTLQGALYRITSVSFLTRGAITQDRGSIVPRPAARIYACYWCVANSAEALSSVMLAKCNDSGYCIEYLNYLLFHVILFTPVTYWCFLLEARWWCEVTDKLAAHRHRPCETGLTICLDLCHVTLKCWKRSNDGRSLSRGHSGDYGRSSATFDEQEDINNPLSGIPWNRTVGQNAAEAIDDLGNFRHRGSSMVMQESEMPSLDVESGKTSSKYGSKKALPKFASKKQQNKLINPPLLNFTRVRILKNHLLGQGSSARVYEGRWCDQPCAIKVLFSMDLKKEEIIRCCEEAKLLHSLNDPHVLKLIGVSVQPPSLSLVLELCSAGSLFDILHKKEEPVPKEGTSTLESFRGIVGSSRGTTVFDRAAVSTAGRIRISSAGGSPAISGMETTGTHCSMEMGRYEHDLDTAYLTRIDLALGAAKGVAAVHEFHMDTDERYSHNDIKSANFLCNWTEPVDGYKKIEVKIADVEFASKEEEKGMWEDSPDEKAANWAAPELYAYPSPKPMGQATDMFALGMVLYEITMRQVPFSTFPDKNLRGKYQAGERPHLLRIFPVPKSRRSSNTAGLSKTELFDRALERQEKHARHVESSGDGEAIEYADRVSRSSVNSFESPSGGSIDATSDESMVEEAKQHFRLLNPTQASENLARLFAYESTVALINQCWSQDPTERPSASDLVESLEKVRAAYVIVSSRCSVYSRHGGGRDAGQDANGGSVSPSLSRNTSQDRPTDVARHGRTMSGEARASRAASALAMAPELAPAPAPASAAPSLISNLDPPV